MKQDKLLNHANCSMCDHPIGKAGGLNFSILVVRRYIVDLQAITRQDGLAALLGGHAGIASAMGPDEDMAVEWDTQEITLCGKCETEEYSVLELMERARVRQG